MPPRKEHKQLKAVAGRAAQEVDRGWRGLDGALGRFQPVKPQAVPAVKNAAWAANEHRPLHPRAAGEGRARACARGRQGAADPACDAQFTVAAARPSRKSMGSSPTPRRMPMRKVVDRLLASPHFVRTPRGCRGSISRATATPRGITMIRCATCGCGAEWVIKACQHEQAVQRGFQRSSRLAGDLISECDRRAEGRERLPAQSHDLRRGRADRRGVSQSLHRRSRGDGGRDVVRDDARPCAQWPDHDNTTRSRRTDFYQLYSFFANVPENGQDGVRDPQPPCPS